MRKIEGLEIYSDNFKRLYYSENNYRHLAFWGRHTEALLGSPLSSFLCSQGSLRSLFTKERERVVASPPLSTSSVNTVNHFEVCLFSQHGCLRKELILLLRTLLFLSVGQSFELVHQWLVRHSIKFGWIKAFRLHWQMWLGARKCKSEAARWLSILWEKYKFCQMECVTFFQFLKGVKGTVNELLSKGTLEENICLKNKQKNQNPIVNFLLQSVIILPAPPPKDLSGCVLLFCFSFLYLPVNLCSFVVSGVFLLPYSW